MSEVILEIILVINFASQTVILGPLKVLQLFAIPVEDDHRVLCFALPDGKLVGFSTRSKADYRASWEATNGPVGG